MDMNEFSAENRARCESPNGFNHSLQSWSLSDWMTATLGELGEAANVVKKLNRVRDGIKGNDLPASLLWAALADELADASIYLDLTAQAAGFSLEQIVRSKFDRTSDKIGYPRQEGFRQRLVHEAADLTEKLIKLGAFVHGDIFPTLPVEDQRLLQEQDGLMRGYLGVLRRRIERLS